MILETERLILRPWKETDAKDLYKYASDPRVGPIAGWPVHASEENSLEIIKNVLSNPYTLALELKEDGSVVGSVGLMIGKESNLEDLPEDEGEVGYWIGVPFWGRGLVPEATKKLIEYGFEVLQLKKLWCGYFDGNEKSKRVKDKCGFKYMYTKKDVYCEAVDETRTEHVSCLLRDDWI
ncbi:GNAT family N-acetyltransferase [Peptostreptococcus faecalis]|uniref:GNAT family N-acetyltransferase n=1 Tax=Peptostreptococcus faecalis TaxID=2045015 RepID=UPI000C7B0DA5|nr:GNAT family N-acetyltransferase [Peptostreptococcus faecalis]